MKLFKPDLYRSFAIGFALGAIAVFVQLDVVADETIVSSAYAATGEGR
jgi:hypothetical protein